MTLTAASTPDVVSLMETIIRAHVSRYYLLYLFSLSQGLEDFFRIVYIIGFADHMLSVATIQLCHCSKKTSIDHA